MALNYFAKAVVILAESMAVTQSLPWPLMPNILNYFSFGISGKASDFSNVAVWRSKTPTSNTGDASIC